METAALRRQKRFPQRENWWRSLGVELIYDNCAIYFHQRRYIQKLLDKFGMTSCNSLLVSMNPKWKLQKETRTPIAWTSKLQPTLLSSNEAEYRVLSEAARNITYFQRLLQELQVKIPGPTPPPLLCDNFSTIMLVKNPIMHQRTKHIELEHHYIWEKFEERSVEVSYISFSKQISLPNPSHNINLLEIKNKKVLQNCL